MNFMAPDNLQVQFTPQGLRLHHPANPGMEWFFPAGDDPRDTAKQLSWPRIPVSDDVDSVIYAFIFMAGRQVAHGPMGAMLEGPTVRMVVGLHCRGPKRAIVLATIQNQPHPVRNHTVCVGFEAGPQGWGRVEIVREILGMGIVKHRVTA